MNGKIKVAAVKAPGFGDNKTNTLQDIAIFTGATMLSEDAGTTIKDQADFSEAMLGTVKKVTVSKDSSIMLSGGGSLEGIQERCDLLKELIDSETSDYSREKLQERLAKLGGGVAVIKTGGASEVEVSEKKDRITDALNATRAAVAEGIVAGGGSALLYATHSLQKLVNDESIIPDQRVGVRLLANALRVCVFACRAVRAHICRSRVPSAARSWLVAAEGAALSEPGFAWRRTPRPMRPAC